MLHLRSDWHPANLGMRECQATLPSSTPVTYTSAAWLNSRIETPIWIDMDTERDWYMYTVRDAGVFHLHLSGMAMWAIECQCHEWMSSGGRLRLMPIKSLCHTRPSYISSVPSSYRKALYEMFENLNSHFLLLLKLKRPHFIPRVQAPAWRERQRQK